MKNATEKLFAVLVFFLLLWTAGLFAFVVHIKGLSYTSAQKTDAIIVLTGGPNRINTGIDLLSKGRAKYLFISGVNEKVTVTQLVDLWRKERETKSTDTDPCCIIIGHDALNTTGNATETQTWMKNNNLQSALLITADYHMPRAWLEFTSLMPQSVFYSHAIVSRKINKMLLIKEYNKTLYTLIRLKIFTALL